MGYYNVSPPEPPYKCVQCTDYFFELDDDGLCKDCAAICTNCGAKLEDAGRTCDCCGHEFCPDCIDKPETYCSKCADEADDDARLGVMLHVAARDSFRLSGLEETTDSSGKRFYHCEYRKDGKWVFGSGKTVDAALQDALALMRAEERKAARAEIEQLKADIAKGEAA